MGSAFEDQQQGRLVGSAESCQRSHKTEWPWGERVLVERAWAWIDSQYPWIADIDLVNERNRDINVNFVSRVKENNPQ
jgi:hypothetical protein